MPHRHEHNPPASSPCLMEEFADELLPPAQDRPASDWPEVRAFRAAERRRLLAERREIALQERRRRAAAVDTTLSTELDLSAYRVLGIYWPIKGELDLRGVALRHALAGGIVALPVVVARNAPLEFWQWKPGQPTTPGAWNIPQPVERNAVLPNALLVPLVGFDAACFRLGYGGGYYDRTLASLPGRPFCIGVADATAQIASIRPQPHDVPMDVIVTDQARRYRAPRA